MLQPKNLTKQSLRRWLELPDADIDEFIDQDLPAKTLPIAGHRQAHGAVPADPNDDIIIAAAALEANAAYIVTEDKHLLELKKYRDIKILSREEFAAELDRLGH